MKMLTEKFKSPKFLGELWCSKMFHGQVISHAFVTFALFSFNFILLMLTKLSVI